MRKLAAVILTHNSDADLPDCLAGLVAQQGVSLDIIVVDNASVPERREQTRSAVLAALPQAHEADAGEAVPEGYHDGDGLFVVNGSNDGYSAGNNIGARIAAELGCEAVLIVNPDVRISSPNYLLHLSDALFCDDANALAASAIRNLQGADENPMFEPSFGEELLAPFSMIAEVLPFSSGNRRSKRSRPSDKLSGCCFLIRMAFLERIGFFDERVFLYCEEAILSAQIRRAGCRSVYLCDTVALHAHRSSAKGDPVLRQRLWSRSRRYYHRAYLGYGALARMALAASHSLIIALTWLQSRRSASAR